ncbi:MAG: hypothetical protein MUF42_09895 [Cytophagaceae bacterium]|jgi:hypothetical protein|nr:hypothetical protein [Cytophagaceae bacterium]
MSLFYRLAQAFDFTFRFQLYMLRTLFFLILFSLLPFFEAKAGGPPRNLFLIGLHSNNGPVDDKLFSMVADSFQVKVDSSFIIDSFFTGKQLLELLEHHSKDGIIQTLILLGHSGTAGYFVEHNSGFYINSFKEYIPGIPLQFTNSSRRISDLKKMVSSGAIQLDSSSLIIALGCNTGNGLLSFAAECSRVVPCAVIGSTQQVGYYKKNELGTGIQPTTSKAPFVMYKNSSKGLSQVVLTYRSLKDLYLLSSRPIR